MKAIKLYFKNKKEDLVYFKTDKNEDVVLPAAYIDFELKEGSSVYLKIQKKILEQEDKKEVARAVLEEILNGRD